MAGTTRLELATSAVTVQRFDNRLISNGVGGHLLRPPGTVGQLLSSPYCTQILFVASSDKKNVVVNLAGRKTSNSAAPVLLDIQRNAV
jgi:hypothetical protein